jgi:pyruvate formate lyase activating enzyme
MKNVMVTNGFIEAGPLRDLLPVIDAMNIDIKSMNPSFYRRLCKGSLAPVLRACEAVKAAGRHLEITHLLIPGENDAPSETEELARFIATHLGADTPLHLSRYFPRHRMKHPPTPAVLLERAWEIARKKLEFVYTGNIADDFREHTRCPRCDTLLITRSGYATRITSSLASGGPGETEKPRCGKCNHGISIVL